MKRRKRMWIDVDEVLADFQSSVFKIVKRLFNRDLDPWHFDGWDMFSSFPKDELAAIFRECERPGFCANLGVVPGAKEAVDELRKHVDLYVVTSPFHSVTWVHERDHWLERNLGFKRSEIVHTSAKHLIAADICLDDKPDNVFNWHKSHPNGLAMIWPIPNTRNLPLEPYRVTGWEEVIRRAVDFEVT